MPDLEADANKLTELQNLSGSLADRVYEVIREAILTLEFPPGAIIRKGAVCERLGISRSPVSGAIQRLETEGLVEVVPQSATRISRMSMQEIRDGAFLREALEIAAAEHVTEHHTSEFINRLTRNVQMQKLQIDDVDYDEFHKTDQEFHKLIIDHCSIARLNDTIRYVSNQVERARFLMLPEPGRVADTLAEHVRILDAIRKQNPDKVRHAMRHHLRQMMTRLESVEKERPEIFYPSSTTK